MRDIDASCRVVKGGRGTSLSYETNLKLKTLYRHSTSTYHALARYTDVHGDRIYTIVTLEKMHPVLDRESQSPIDSQTFSLFLSPHFLV